MLEFCIPFPYDDFFFFYSQSPHIIVQDDSAARSSRSERGKIQRQTEYEWDRMYSYGILENARLICTHTVHTTQQINP